jgi:hypothetical protein
MTLNQLLELRSRSDAILDCCSDEELAYYQTATMFEGINNVPISAVGSCLKEEFLWHHWQRVISHLFEAATGYAIADLDEVSLEELDCEI